MRKSIRRFTLSLVAALLMLGWGQAEAQPRANKDTSTQQKVVNLNTGTLDQLMLLPGIGPSKGRAIIKYRLRQKFSNTFQIIRVRGIGRKTYRKLRPYLATKGPTTLTAKPRLKKTPSQ